MRRREFIALFLAALPSLGRAERANADKLRLIGVLDALREGDDEAEQDAFRQQLDKLGWIAGQNVKIEYRWGAGSVDHLQAFAKELVTLNPDVLVSITTPASIALQSRPRPFRLCLHKCPIRSVADSLKAWRVRAATLPALSTSRRR